MIKLKSLLNLKEEEDKAPISVQDTIEAFFTKNKSKLEKLSDDDDWDAFYELGFEAFPGMEEGDVAQAMNRAMLNSGWVENEDVAEMPTEKDLELAAFGDKKLQKGINTAEYDKLAKLPKNPENIKESFKKKGRVTEMATAESTKVDSFLGTIKSSVKSGPRYCAHSPCGSKACNCDCNCLRTFGTAGPINSSRKGNPSLRRAATAFNTVPGCL